jgi:THO complex subunit 3
MKSLGSPVFKDIKNLHDKHISDCRWSSDGIYLGTVSKDKTAKITQIDNQGLCRIIHSPPITNEKDKTANIFIWNPIDSKRFGIAGDSKTIELWDVRSQKAASKITSLGNNLSIAWSPDGKYLAIVNKSDNLSVVDLSMGEIVKNVKIAYEINEVSWSANSDHILVATGAPDHQIDLIGFKDTNLNMIEGLSAHTSNARFLKIDPTFRRLAVGSVDHTVSIWDLEDLVCDRIITLDSSVTGLTFSGDGTEFAAASETPTILICDSYSGETLAKVDIRNDFLSMAWHPTQRLIALATAEKSINNSYLKLLTFPSAQSL